MHDRPMRDSLPFELGRYRLTERIGSGSMGVVYRGEDPLLGRDVAVKVVRTDLLEESERNGYCEGFRREAQLAASCIHPGIVTVYDYAEKDDNPYIVMEYVEGQSLQRLLLDQQKLPVKIAVDLTLQILAALGHAHERGIVHRDIKPANIIVDPRSRLKIADFGIARVNTASSTMAGLLLGTPNYMAPERARGENADHRSDLFAVGVVLYRMVTGLLPYGDLEAAAVLQKTAGPEPIDLSELDAGEPRIASAVALALTKDPARRFQSADEFAHMLRAVTLERSGADIWPTSAHELAGPSASANPPCRGGGWPEPLLAELQAEFAIAIGPIAKFLLTRVAGASTDTDALLAGLCNAIEHKAARAEFAGRARTLVKRHCPRAAEGGLGESSPVVPLDVVKASAALLARFVGPIAVILARRSALEVGSVDEFGDRLATHIKRRVDREAFRTAFDAGRKGV